MTTFERVSASFKNCPLFSCFVLGSCIGILAPLIYMISGGDVFLFVPVWATILFFPGFLVGNLVDNLAGYWGAIVVGIVALALSFGLIAMVIGRFSMAVRKRP